MSYKHRKRLFVQAGRVTPRHHSDGPIWTEDDKTCHIDPDLMDEVDSA